MDAPMNLLKIATLLVTLTVTCILGAPTNDKSVEQDVENNSRTLNEVGPSQEDWKLYEQLAKSKAIDPSNDPGMIKKLFKEIEEYSLQAQTTYLPNDNENNEGKVPPEDQTAENDSAESVSSEWFESLWKEITDRLGGASDHDDDDSDSKEDVTTTTDTPIDVQSPQADQPQQQQQDGDNDDPVEDIIKKLSNDLKKLYNKMKQVIKTVRNWVEQRNEGVKLDEMSGSATEQDGVFVIADPIIGDSDKSNKYALPINAE